MKIVVILLGLTGGNSKYPCHLCEFDSRASEEKKYTETFKRREGLVIDQFGVNFASLVDPNLIIIPPLHVKLGITKNLVKTLNEDAVKYLNDLFFKLSDEKVEEGVLDGPDIRKLIGDPEFRNHLTPTN